VKLYLSLPISLLLISCAKQEPQIVYTTTEVKVPVYTIPEFTIPNEPFLPLRSLTEEDKGDHNAIGKAYVSSIKLLEGYGKKLRNLLEGKKNGSVK